MAIMTVKGEIPKEEMGIVLPHEHLLIDLRGLVDEPAPGTHPEFYEKVRLDNRYLLWSDPYTLLDNALIDGEETAERELLAFRAAGGGTVVDVTLDAIGRDPEALARLQQKTGVNIVMGCGYYVAGAHPRDMGERTREDLADEMIRDIEEGVRGTGVKAGVIGEIGTGDPVHPDEWKAVEAAAIACRETGKAVHVHTALWGDHGAEIVGRMERLGAAAERVCIDHIDVCLRPDYLRRLLDAGCWIEFDNFGKEFFMPKRETGLLRGRFAYDLERTAVIADLVKEGYGDKILVTNDICLKNMLRAYGGNGYAHVVTNVVPMLLDSGVSEEQIDRIYRINPGNFLDGGK